MRSPYRPVPLVVVVLVALTIGCASQMANLQTPEGRQAYYQNEVLIRIERLQTAAIDANAKSALPDAVAIPIVRFTVGAAKVIRTSPQGWLASVTVAWNEAKAAIPPPIATTYEAYILAIDTILATVRGGTAPRPIAAPRPLGGLR